MSVAVHVYCCHELPCTGNKGCELEEVVGFGMGNSIGRLVGLFVGRRVGEGDGFLLNSDPPILSFFHNPSSIIHFFLIFV